MAVVSHARGRHITSNVISGCTTTPNGRPHASFVVPGCHGAMCDDRSNACEHGAYRFRGTFPS